MGDNSAIEWCDASWNPVTGCTKVSPGCKNCYAEVVADRFWKTQYPKIKYEARDSSGMMQRGERERCFVDVMCHEDRLNQPLRWKKPRRIFVNSMSDLFHEDVPDAFIDRVFSVMAFAERHTFQVLTKRPERMREYVSDRVTNVADAIREIDHKAAGAAALTLVTGLRLGDAEPRRMWPLRNVWLGVSVENQHFADERIPLLLQTPAAVRFISAEPLLGPLNLIQFLSSNYYSVGGRQWVGAGGIHWVIFGGESGAGARPMDLAWVRSGVRQCRDAGVAPFVKQLGAKPVGLCTPACNIGPHDMKFMNRKGGDLEEWPKDLRVREYPEVSR